MQGTLARLSERHVRARSKEQAAGCRNFTAQGHHPPLLLLFLQKLEQAWTYPNPGKSVRSCRAGDIPLGTFRLPDLGRCCMALVPSSSRQFLQPDPSSGHSIAFTAACCSLSPSSAKSWKALVRCVGPTVQIAESVRGIEILIYP